MEFPFDYGAANSAGNRPRNRSRSPMPHSVSTPSHIDVDLIEATKAASPITCSSLSPNSNPIEDTLVARHMLARGVQLVAEMAPPGTHLRVRALLAPGQRTCRMDPCPKSPSPQTLPRPRVVGAVNRFVLEMESSYKKPSVTARTKYFEELLSSFPASAATLAAKNSTVSSSSAGAGAFSATALQATSKARNDMLNNENAALRDRVADLERKVAEQEDELICLRSSMADVLRRLGLLESNKVVTSSPPSGAAVRSLSQSSTNLRRNTAGSGSLAFATPSHGAQMRRTASPSQRRLSAGPAFQNGGGPNGHHHGGIPPGGRGQQQRQSSPQGTPTAAMTQSMMAAANSANAASAANIRKWVSSNDFIDGVVNPSSVRSSNANLNSSMQREPSFNPDEGCLRFYIRNRVINLYAPSDFLARTDFDPARPLAAPKAKLKLEWVYGYRGKDCRSNLYLLPTGEIVYFTAAVVVLYNPEEQLQRHYLGHTDDIKCMAVHPNRLVVATGQLTKHGGAKNRGSLSADNSAMESLPEEADYLPHVRIWDSVSLQTQQIIGIGDFERAVSCIGFSKADGGALLAVVDESYDHTLSIWDWQRRQKLADTKSANEAVFACEFHPTERTLLITCGKSQINFWTFDGVTLQRKGGVFDARDKPKYVLCIAFTENGEVLSGDSNGTISVWSTASAKVTRAARAVHDGGVFSICPLKGGRIVTGGGKDRRLIEWDEQLRKTGKEVELPESAGPVRTIMQGKGAMLLVGTTHNCILQGTFQLNFQFLMQGHGDELWGLTAHPHQRQFLTCGYDKTVRLWDSISRTVIWCKEIGDTANCCCFHPGGHVLVVGTGVGRWLVLDALTREIVFGQMDGNEVIADAAFSPDGLWLALASHDHSVYVYGVSEDARKYSRVGRCTCYNAPRGYTPPPGQGHSAVLVHLDWSLDNQYIRTNASDYELICWQASTCRPVPAASLRDVEWATERCSVSWATAGVWADGAEASDVNSVDCNADRTLLATAEDSGLIKLFQYPCAQPKSGYHAYAAHSSHVTGVRFLEGGNRLVSIGGKDSAVLQWSIVD